MRWGQYKISYIDNENKDKSKHLNISKGGLQGYLQISSEMHQKTSFIRYESMQSNVLGNGLSWQTVHF